MLKITAHFIYFLHHLRIQNDTYPKSHWNKLNFTLGSENHSTIFIFSKTVKNKWCVIFKLGAGCLLCLLTFIFTTAFRTNNWFINLFCYCSFRYHTHQCTDRAEILRLEDIKLNVNCNGFTQLVSISQP